MFGWYKFAATLAARSANAQLTIHPEKLICPAICTKAALLAPV